VNSNNNVGGNILLNLLMKKYFLFPFFLFVALLLNGCQDSEVTTDDSGNNAVKSGKVAIVLTDAPTDEFSEVNLTITQIALLREDDNDDDSDSDDESKDNDSDDSKVVIFEGEETVNLLALENYSHLFALSADVPVGTYHKIRLTLKKEGGIELVKHDESGEVSELHYPKLTGNAKLDLNARQSFEVVEDETLIIQLDIDAKKSINIVKTGKGAYKFRPVVFVDVITPEFSGKLIRHSGFIRNLDLNKQRFNMCANTDSNNADVEAAITELCLLVHITDASLFDDNGDAIVPADLANDQYVTAIGYLQNYNSKTDNLVEYGQLLAQVLHTGDQTKFAVVDGEVKTEIDDVEQTFTFQVESDTEVTVLLQDDTKIFSRDGSAINIDQIVAGRMLEVHGVFDSENASLLKSTLIIVGPEIDAQLLKFSGKVLEVFSGSESLLMTTDEGDRTIMIVPDAVILSVNTSSEASFSKIINLADIEESDRIEVYGADDGTGVFQANIILVVTD